MTPPGPPVPVPSKAAIRALRGLVLGTTCSLALVAEDRRRRINAANSAIRNARTIRSASRYNAGGSALAIALEEESLVVVEPSVISWKQIEGGVTSTSASTLALENGAHIGSAADAKTKAPGQQRPEPGESSGPVSACRDEPPPPIAQPSQPHAHSTTPLIRRYVQRMAPSIADKAQEYQSRTQTARHHSAQQQSRLTSSRAGQPAVASSAPTQTSRRQPKPRRKCDDEIAVKALLATLLKACTDSAQTNLNAEQAKLAKQEETAEGSIRIPETGAQNDPFVNRFQGAVARFVSVLSASATARSADELVNAGRPLLDCLFALEHQPSIKAVYAAVICQCPGDIFAFSYWYIRKLDKAGYHGLLVSSFLARPPSPESLPNWLAFFNVCDRVVEATRLNHYRDADKVLATLLTCRPRASRLKTPWATDLIYGHWTRTKSYEETRALFAGLTARTGQPVHEVVNHVDAAYRVMVQISLEAGELAAAQALFDELVTLQPSSRGDVRILGLFALEKAKMGDWPAVHVYFQTALGAVGDGAIKGNGPERRLPARDAERVLVPIVKEHIKHHSIAETETFLKMCISDHGIPIGRQMVTLLANEYGALRDVRTFIDWLWYCSSAGFTVDAAFSNAILQNCRKHWKFSFRDLRTIYRKLRVLSPNFEDKVTQTIMTHAAISDAKHIGRPAKGRVLSLRIQPPPKQHDLAPPPELVMGRRQQQYLDEDDLYVAMKTEFASGFPAKAVRIYKHAMRGGMPPSTKCLSLAVGATIRSGREQKRQPHRAPGHQTDLGQTGDAHAPPASPALGGPVGAEFDAAVDLIRSAHAAGQDIGDAAAYLAIAYIDSIGPRTISNYGRAAHEQSHRGKTSVATAVKAILTRLGTHNAHMSGLALNRAAFHLYKASHLRGALALAKSAAHTPKAAGGGGGFVGYNAYNFSVMVAVYARLADAEGIRMAAKGAARSGAIADLMGYKVLKQSKRRLRAALKACDAPESSTATATATATDTGTGTGTEPRSPAAAHHTYTAAAKRAHLAHVQAALAEIEHALALARTARQKLAADRAEVDAGSVEVMQQAAQDAGRQPVDFDEIPFLRRGKKDAKDAAAAPFTDADDKDWPTVKSTGGWDLRYAAVADHPAQAAASP